MELPLWLAVHLAQRDICEIKMPSYLSDKYQQSMQAGSEILNLRNQSAAVYENTLKLCAHLEDENVVSTLQSYLNTFLERFSKLIIDLADSGEIKQNEQFAHDLKKLSNLEQEIFGMHRR